MYLPAARALLAHAGAEVVCVDVGAAGGLHPRISGLAPHARFLAFEPDHEEWTRLSASATAAETFVNAAVGRSGERLTLNLHRRRNTSWVYETDNRRVSHFDAASRWETEEIDAFETRSLDEVCGEHGIAAIDYLKVDCEGHEL